MAKPKNRDAKPSTTQKTRAAISALDLLEEEHNQVEAFFEEYEALDEVTKKQELAVKICMALQVHSRIEEEIFYPAVRSAIEKTELIDEALVEHASAKQLVAEIEAMDAGDELYDAKVKVLGEQVMHHIEEEENELFPEVESSELDLEALGAKLAERKVALFDQLAEKGEPL